jgi:transposase-like protein
MAYAGDRHSKERFWRDLVQQWLESGQSVRAFCRTQHVPEGSFYAWRRTIAQRQQQAGSSLSLQDASRTAGVPLFVPVQLSAVAVPPFEVVLEHGQVIRVPAGFDAGTLRQLLAVLAEAPSC